MIRLALSFVAAVALASTGYAQSTAPEFNPAVQLGTVAHTSLTEISGIAASRQNADVIWAHNDSGDTNRVFAMTTGGKHLGMYYLGGASAVDWEDMAVGPGPIPGQQYLYVADTGNNELSRMTVTLYRAPEPVVLATQSPLQTTLSGVETLPVRFPDTIRDVETLIVDPENGDILLLTRDRQQSGTTYIYLYPVEAQTPGALAMLTLVGSIASTVEIKGGDVSADGQWLLLRRHSSTTQADGWLYARATGTAIEQAFNSPPTLVPLAAEPQGEAVAFRPGSSGYYTISEGTVQPIYYYGPLTAPATPDKGSATAVSSTEIRLTWSDNANNEASYKVERSTNGLYSGTPVLLGANATAFTDANLSPGTKYSYGVTAYNSAGNSGSLLLYATTAEPPPMAPSAPTELSATAVSKSQITLAWADASLNEEGFKIERSNDGKTFTQIASVGAGVTRFTNNNLSANKLYYYRVRAYNVGGNSGFTNVASARTLRR